MSIILFGFLRAPKKRRDMLVWKEETEDLAKKRFIKNVVSPNVRNITDGLSKVRWGWIEINTRFVTLCIAHYEPALNPRVLVENCAQLTKNSIITFPDKDCQRDDVTLCITPSMEIMGCLTDACMTSMRIPRMTGDFDADTRIYPGWEEKTPVDLYSYKRIGLEIMNIQHLVPPGRRTTSYHIPAAIGTLVGKVPAIAIDLCNPEHVRFAYRSTSLLRLHYGAVRLVAREPVQGEFLGQAGRDHVAHVFKGNGHMDLGPIENLSIQRLAPLFKLPSKDKAIPQLFPKRCMDPRFEGVTILSSKPRRFQPDGFTYASVWEQPAPIFSKSTHDFTSPTYPLLSDSSLKALAFLPFPLKQDVTPPVQAWYLAGVGSNKQGTSVLQSLDHDYAGVLASLPQTLVIAAMLRHYIDDRETYEGPIHDHFHTLYDNVIKTSPGIVDSWTYFGTRGSFFPFHQEDALLPSANLMVLGDPKVWIFITASGMELLRPILADYIAPCYMLHRSVFFHPVFLARHNIPFTIAVQNEGELILADAQSGHQGWNMGPNLAEAVNYADVAAMEYQKDELYRDGMTVWPCVCGFNPVPTDPARKQGKATGQSIPLYRPEWDKSDGLGCSALYQWVETLMTELDIASHSPPLIEAKQLLDLRMFVYEKAHEKLPSRLR